jgi:glycosyltransferase involved in cell wall biosynthesis
MGIDLQIRYLLGDDYLRQRFEGGGLSLTSILSGSLCRLRDLALLKNFDVAIIYCELFPLMPAWLERQLISLPYIYDFDDAFYLKYQSVRFRGVEPLLRHKFENLIRAADGVTAGNRVLADYAGRFNQHTSLLPTVVDPTRYFPNVQLRNQRMFTVGWIGSPSTAPYLSQLVQPLSALGLESPVRFLVIGGRAPLIPNVNTIEIGWSEDTEVELLNHFDVGVMPLPDDDWARGKCAFKLIQYMACGVPVIASPVGANSDVVSQTSGFLATTSGEWLNALRQLRDNPALRLTMGQNSRERVVEHYSLPKKLPDLAQVIRRASQT